MLYILIIKNHKLLHILCIYYIYYILSLSDKVMIWFLKYICGIYLSDKVVIWFLIYICGINIHFGGLMVATLKLRDSFGKLLTDDCLGANIKVKLLFCNIFRAN